MSLATEIGTDINRSGIPFPLLPNIVWHMFLSPRSKFTLCRPSYFLYSFAAEVSMCLRSILKPLAVILFISFAFISPLAKADALSIARAPQVNKSAKAKEIRQKKRKA